MNVIDHSGFAIAMLILSQKTASEDLCPRTLAYLVRLFSKGFHSKMVGQRSIGTDCQIVTYC